MIFIEIQIGKDDKKNRKYHMELGATADCTNRMTEDTNVLRQRWANGATKACFIFYRRFFSMRSEEYVIDVGAYIIGIVKTNIKGLCKDTI